MQNTLLKSLKPYLKYPGGKSKIVPHIQRYWELHKKHYPDSLFVELFCGSAAVSLGIRPERALLNDANPHVINLHRQVQEGAFSDGDNVIYDNVEEQYYQAREWFNSITRTDEDLPMTQAALLYYLNHTCYNGMMRFNRKGEFNVPYGKYKKVNFIEDFTPWQQAFEKYEFSCLDFRQVQIPENSFVYCDPPYDGGFTNYTKDEFTWEDQVALAEMVSNSSSAFLLSNAATDRILELYLELGFDMEFIEVQRSVSCDGKNRKKVKEVLAWKSR